MLREFVKKKVVVISVILISLLVILLMMVLNTLGILREFFPLEKKKFDSYNEFRMSTSDYFPDELPPSASDTKYYYYEGHYDRIHAMSTFLSDEDIDKVFSNYKSRFKIFSDKIENVKLDDAFIERENLSFLSNLIDGKGNYKIFKYVNVSGGTYSRVKKGLIYNQKQGHVIIFYYEDSNLMPW